MKNAPLVLSSLAFIGVLILFGMHFSSNKPATKSSTVSTTSTTNAPTSGKIAYVNIDTLESHYDYLKNKKAEFNKRQAAIQNELEASAQRLQNDFAAAQQKAQSGNMSQAEAEATQKRLSQMKQSLDTRSQAVTEQLLKERDNFNLEIQKKLDAFLEEYNKDKGYDYIFSYSKGNMIMYADKRLDITEDVIKGMNELSKSGKADTTGKK